MSVAIPLIQLGIKGLITCEVVRRLNRFTVLVRTPSNELANAYIRNTGRLADILVEGRKGYCVRKYSGHLMYNLIGVKYDGGAALLDTLLQMKVFEILISNGYIEWAAGCSIVKRNVRLGSSLLDYLLLCSNEYVFTEVKSAVLRTKEGCAAYPDTVSVRGRRHVSELISHVRGGGKGLLVFIAALPNVECFRVYREVDELMERLVRDAIREGVMVRSIRMYLNYLKYSIIVDNLDLPIILA